MNRGLIIWAAALCLALPATAQQKISAPKPFAKRVSTTFKGRCVVITPQSYQRQSAERWPMIVFLHGGDQGGPDISLVMQHALPKIALEDPDFPFVLMVPQIPAGKTFQADGVVALVKQIARSYKIDSQRIYATGPSLGGYAVWDLGIRHPEWFAAIAPIAGGANTLDLKMAEGAKVEAMRSMGIWAFHGELDTAVDPDESARMVEEFRRTGVIDARLTIYPGGPHDIWDRAYRDPELYSWFLQHSRPIPPR